MSTLYIIGTPIGNLEDITLRALKILGQVDVVACEDTRMTKKIFARHIPQGKASQSKGGFISYHMHSKLSRINEIVSLLKEGKDIALVSDAGTPGISDPGSELVSLVRRDLASEISSGIIKIESVPGPSALTAALSVAGVPCANFVFLGFLPHKKGRETLFKEIASHDRTYVFYESPHRIIKTLESLVEHTQNDHSGQPEENSKKVTVCRELTKVFEEIVSGSPSLILEYFNKHADKVRGEFVVIVSQI